MGPADRAATRYVFAADDMSGLLRALGSAGSVPRASTDGTAAFCTGPDGHGFLFVRG